MEDNSQNMLLEEGFEDEEGVEEGDAKRRRFNKCFSFMEIQTEPGIKSLKHIDSEKFKAEIKRWAKAVVAYARQVSDRCGSSRRT